MDCDINWPAVPPVQTSSEGQLGTNSAHLTVHIYQVTTFALLKTI